MANTVLIALVIAGCFALSFFLSGMEAGVFALSRLRIRQRLREGDPRAALLLGYLEKPEAFLWTILVGNSLANFILVAFVLAGLHEVFGDRPWVFWMVFVVFLFLLYALGDLLPKLLFQMLPNRLCLWLARPFRLVHLGLAPWVWGVTQVSQGLLRWTGGQAFIGRLFGNREELRLVMQESAKGFTSEERAMINRVLDLETRRLNHVLVPMDKVVSVTVSTPMPEVVALCRQHNLTRLPVWDDRGSRRRVVGIISLKSLLYRPDLPGRGSGGDYVKPALYLTENVRLEDALRRMQRSGHRLAIVLDRDRHELGIVCLQDILKAMFGEVSL